MTDAELVASLKANDDAAYREVVARFGDPLYGYIYSLTGDHHLSEDILSETYLRMVEKIDTYTYYGAPFKAWLYRIAHNLAINALKRASRLVGAEALETAAPLVDDPAITIARRIGPPDEPHTLVASMTEAQAVSLRTDQRAGRCVGVVHRAASGHREPQPGNGPDL